VGILLDYAAPELAAWVSAHREAVLRAAEAVDAAYVAEVDALAPLLPGGETVWERASASLTIYDSESEEHRARKPTRVENVEGWQSRVTDKHGKRSVVALLPVRLPSGHGFSAHLENRWVHGHGFDRAWTLTTVWPSAIKPLELADYDARRMGVRVEDLENEEVQAERVPLDAAHEALFRWIRDIIAKSHSASRMPNILNPDVLRRVLLQSKMLGRVEGREGEADSIVSSVIRFASPRNAPWETHSYLMNRKQVQAVQDRLLATGVIVYKRLDRFGKEVAASKEGKDYLFFSGEPYHVRLRREREEEEKREREGEETRRQGVDVSQQTGEEGGGGSTMPKATLSPDAKRHYTHLIRSELARGGRVVMVPPDRDMRNFLRERVYHDGVVVLDDRGRAVQGRTGTLRPEHMEELLAAGLVAKTTTDEGETVYVKPTAKRGVTFGAVRREPGERTRYVDIYNDGEHIGDITIEHEYNKLAQQTQFRGVFVELNEPSVNAAFQPVLRGGASKLAHIVKGEGYADARTAMTAAKAWVREQVAKAAKASA
jgi:hypothetical protein